MIQCVLHPPKASVRCAGVLSFAWSPAASTRPCSIATGDAEASKYSETKNGPLEFPSLLMLLLRRRLTVAAANLNWLHLHSPA